MVRREGNRDYLDYKIEKDNHDFFLQQISGTIQSLAEKYGVKDERIKKYRVENAELFNQELNLLGLKVEFQRDAYILVDEFPQTTFEIGGRSSLMQRALRMDIGSDEIRTFDSQTRFLNSIVNKKLGLVDLKRFSIILARHASSAVFEPPVSYTT